ncbi:MAG: hypothetical protein PGN26_14445 [Xylophilus ampelinus]
MAKKRVKGHCSARKLQEMRSGPCRRQGFRVGRKRLYPVICHRLSGRADDLRGVAYGWLRGTWRT